MEIIKYVVDKPSSKYGGLSILNLFIRLEMKRARTPGESCESCDKRETCAQKIMRANAGCA